MFIHHFTLTFGSVSHLVNFLIHLSEQAEQITCDPHFTVVTELAIKAELELAVAAHDRGRPMRNVAFTEFVIVI